MRKISGSSGTCWPEWHIRKPEIDFYVYTSNVLHDVVQSVQFLHAWQSTSMCTYCIYRTIMAWWYFSVSLISHELVHKTAMDHEK